MGDIKSSGFEATGNFDFIAPQIGNSSSDLLKLNANLQVQVSTIHKPEKQEIIFELNYIRSQASSKQQAAFIS